MANSTKLKCDCPTCISTFDVAAAINKNGKVYCSESSANGHTQGQACSTPTCHCCE